MKDYIKVITKTGLVCFKIFLFYFILFFEMIPSEIVHFFTAL